MDERDGASRLPTYLVAAAALAAAGAVWYRYECSRRYDSRLAREAARALAEAEAVADRVFESTPETRFEDRDHRHRDAAKYD